MAIGLSVAAPFALPTGYVVVPLSGEVDMATSDAVAIALADAARRARAGVIADLSGLTFIDASGLRVLIRAHQRTGHLAAGLRIAGAPANVRRLLRVMHLDRYLSIYPTVTAAARSSD